MDLGVGERWRTRFFSTWLEPGVDSGSGLPSTGADNAGSQKTPIFLPTCAPALGLQSSRASCSCARSARSRPGPGCARGRIPRVQAGECGGCPPPSRTVGEDGGRRFASACGDGWSQVGREESDLWGQGTSRSIWAGGVRGNRYFR